MLSGLSYAIDTPTGTPQGGSMNRNRWVWVGIYAARKFFRISETGGCGRILLDQRSFASRGAI
jgi:hypothetical protein